MCNAVDRWQRELRERSWPEPPDAALCDTCLVCPLFVPGTGCTPEWAALHNIYRRLILGEPSPETAEIVELFEEMIQSLERLGEEMQSCS